MSWRVAKSLETLRQQINDEWPKRNKASDGTIGDAAHSSRASDHNPWIRDGAQGVVSALDITNDPANGVVSHAIAQALIQSRDSRIKYIISNGQIISGTDGPSPWVWRKYSGTNPHTRHFHLSVKSSKAFYDDTKPWSFKALANTVSVDLRLVQSDLISLGYPEVKFIDGIIGTRTRGAIAAFMKDRGAVASTSATPEVAAEITKAKAEGWKRP